MHACSCWFVGIGILIKLIFYSNQLSTKYQSLKVINKSEKLLDVPVKLVSIVMSSM